MRVVQTLGDRNAVTVMASVKKSRAARVPHSLPRRIDILIARAIKHSRDAIAHGNFRLHAHRGSLSTRGRKRAIQNASFGHMNFNRAKPAVAPRHVPKEEVGHHDGNLSYSPGQSRIGAVTHLAAGSREIQK